MSVALENSQQLTRYFKPNLKYKYITKSAYLCFNVYQYIGFFFFFLVQQPHYKFGENGGFFSTTDMDGPFDPKL